MRSTSGRSAPGAGTLRALVVGVLAVGFLACDRGGEDQQRTSADATVTLQTLRWETVPGAAGYRVRAWADARLLFEETVTSESLEWSPSLARSAQPFDDVEVFVQGLDAEGRTVGEPQVLPVVLAR